MIDEMIVRTGLCIAALALSACTTSAVSTSSSSSAGKAVNVVALQDRFAATMPLGDMLAYIASQDPNWPLQTRMDQFNAKDVACMRREMAPENGHELMRSRAADYARKHPERVQDDIRLLDAGVVRFVGSSLRAGMTGSKEAPPQNPNDLKAVVEVMTEPKHADLREAMYLDALQDAMLSPTRRYEAGQRLGLRMFAPMTLDAAKKCGLDLLSDSPKKRPLKRS